ncbi:MAG: T9SS type A sorting domain-containing protein [Bacteroidales bacterium]|nr:T9SS type A sorting domain-containing protein [Bacteroidales bacterium]
MKKFVTLMIAMTFTASLFAQIALINFDVQEQPYDVYENGAVIDVDGIPSDLTLAAELGIWNQGTTAANVICRRTDLDVIEGTSNYFCWGMCFPSTIYLSQPVPMDPDFADFWGFSAHYEMRDADFNQIPLPFGTTSVRYSFYDERTPEDSVWVIVNYNVSSEAAINEMNAISSNVYPNPAKDQIFVESEMVENGTIAIFNMVGQKIKEVAQTSNKVAINVSELQTGVYFYTIFSDGQKMDSQRFVVSK